MYRVLLVDDRKETFAFLVNVLQVRGWDAVLAGSGEEGLALFNSSQFDLVITDIKMEPMDGLELLRRIREQKPDMPVILMTGYRAFNSGVEALKLEAFDYLPKPFDITTLLNTMNRALAYHQALQGCVDLALVVGVCHSFGSMVYVSEAMRAMQEEIAHSTRLETGVLISGERGVGKELVARLIHSMSSHHDAEFVKINCAQPDRAGDGSKSLESIMELAGEGSIFFELVDHMPVNMQKELMQAMASKEADDEETGEHRKRRPRILASTTLPLDELKCPAGFDPELYAMLVFTKLKIPSLRNRRADILPLAQHLFERELGNVAGLRMDLDVIMIMEHYEWPGNVGELEQMVKTVISRGCRDRVKAEHLPETIREAVGPVTSLNAEDLKKEFLHGESLGRFLREQGRKEAEQLKSSVALKLKEDKKKEAGRTAPHA